MPSISSFEVSGSDHSQVAGDVNEAATRSNNGFISPGRANNLMATGHARNPTETYNSPTTYKGAQEPRQDTPQDSCKGNCSLRICMMRVKKWKKAHRSIGSNVRWINVTPSTQSTVQISRVCAAAEVQGFSNHGTKCYRDLYYAVNSEDNRAVQPYEKRLSDENSFSLFGQVTKYFNQDCAEDTTYRDRFLAMLRHMTLYLRSEACPLNFSYSQAHEETRGHGSKDRSKPAYACSFCTNSRHLCIRPAMLPLNGVEGGPLRLVLYPLPPAERESENETDLRYWVNSRPGQLANDEDSGVARYT